MSMITLTNPITPALKTITNHPARDNYPDRTIPDYPDQETLAILDDYSENENYNSSQDYNQYAGEVYDSKPYGYRKLDNGKHKSALRW